MRVKATLVAATTAAAVLGTAAAGAAERQAVAERKPPPVVEQLVAFPNGKTKSKRVRARETTAKVGDRRCAIPAATPLAALVRSRPKELDLEDFGSCSSDPRDAAGLYVRGLGGEREKGLGGWVYKVGRRIGTAGAGDPAGPFGGGRLKRGALVTWFYCVKAGNCQRTLAARAKVLTDGSVHVRVSAYDDSGDGVAAGGAAVKVGKVTTTADAGGVARLSVPSGTHRVAARKEGLVPALPTRVRVP